MNTVNDTKTIFIQSIGKRVTNGEFLEMLPKPGEVYKINDSNIWRCVDNTFLSFDKIVVQTQANGNYTCYVMYCGSAEPGLDFVNHVADGSYVKVHPKVFESLETKLLSISGAAGNIIRNAESIEKIFQFDEN